MISKILYELHKTGLSPILVQLSRIAARMSAATGAEIPTLKANLLYICCTNACYFNLILGNFGENGRDSYSLVNTCGTANSPTSKIYRRHNKFQDIQPHLWRFSVHFSEC